MSYRFHAIASYLTKVADFNLPTYITFGAPVALGGDPVWISPRSLAPARKLLVPELFFVIACVILSLADVI